MIKSKEKKKQLDYLPWEQGSKGSPKKQKREIFQYVDRISQIETFEQNLSLFLVVITLVSQDSKLY